MVPIFRLSYTSKILLAWIVSCQQLWAWNANGHVLISRMAYEKMHPQTQKWLNQMLAPDFDLDSASVWLDQLHSAKYKQFKKTHYIDLPIGDERFFPKLDTINALTAINHAKIVLADNTSSLSEKKLAVRILLHVIADVHQPLHTTAYYSKKYPKGDKGGNLWHIKHGNLHRYWDGGAGFLKGFSRFDLNKLSNKKDKVYLSCHEKLSAELKPEEWIKQSHQIAMDFAYFPSRNRKKWLEYQTKAQSYSKQQILKAAIDMAATFDQLAKS